MAYKKSGEIEPISNLKLNKNCKFEITAIDETTITIKYIRCDLVETSQLPDVVHQYKLVAHKKEFSMIYYEYFIELPIYAVRKLFIPSYCRTGHSLQGVTVQDSITLFDWDLPYITLKWIWVAITRTTSLDNVKIYNGKCFEFNETVIAKCFEKKIKEYQLQDSKSKLPIDHENYVNIKWFKQFLSTPCPRCNNTYVINHNTY